MGDKSAETKARILKATQRLLEGTDPEKITIREIAAEAGIGIGLINYHFKTRDNLIREAVGTRLTSMAEIMENLEGDAGNPAEYLKRMLKAMSDVAMKNPKLTRVSVEYEMLKGNYRICLYLLPALKAATRGERSETELRLIAFQIIVALQNVYLRQDAFHFLTGIDIEKKDERDKLIHSIVDNLIKNGGQTK